MRINENQNIVDICLQNYGTLDSLFDLVIENNLDSINTDLSSGDELDINTALIVDEKASLFFENNSLSIVTNSGATVYDDFDDGFNEDFGDTFVPPVFTLFNDKATTFDGTNEYVDIIGSKSTLNVLENTGVFTWNLWFKLDNYLNSAARILVGNNAGNAGNKGFFIGYIGTTDKIRLVITDGAGEVADISTITTMKDNDWHLYTVTCDNTTLRVYLDGVEDNTSLKIFGGSGDSNADVSFGRSNDYSGFYFDGTLDDVSFWDTDLSASQISDIYTDGRYYTNLHNLPEYSANCISRCNMDDLNSTDSKGSNDGTFTNMDISNVITT